MNVNELENELKLILKDAVKVAFDIDVDNIDIMIPKDKAHGDYATNVAMKICGRVKQKPQDVAHIIVSNIDLEKHQIKKIEVVGPGFMNFFLEENKLAALIGKIIDKGNDFGKGNPIDEKINVEFVSANPTGDLHLGHARQAALGDSICRCLSFAGYDVKREYYINDLGNQIDNLTISALVRYKELFGISEELPENGYHGKEIITLAKELKEKYGNSLLNDDSIETYEKVKSFSTNYMLDEIKRILKEFRVSFDIWSSEKANKEAGFTEKALEKLSPYIYKSEDATWLRTTDFGDDKDRVLVKTDGAYTYFAPDIGYHMDKMQRGYDRLIDLLGADHHGYVNRMNAALMGLGFNKDTLHIELVQMVRLMENGIEVKMSKRTGKSVTIKDLIEEVGIDATRYFFVSRAASTHFDFDLGLAKSTSNENPVYYAQYAYARICSILESAKQQNFELDLTSTLITHPKELQLLRMLNEFPNVVVDAAQTLSPYKVCNYIQKVAALFHGYYSECRVIDKDNIVLSEQRLALLEATKVVLGNAFDLIAIEKKEKM
ncbi:MAG: arginine--tRNA ligase [Erysipelotrichaceae bacterium]|nr:arginine--tRNA ligase [Erysipelotrichaceae bacterium]